ncbi:P-selectin-like isoform X2 [Panonychus citri]|uniref:P-selectin-like isoform X2 n=1 Tax=Panonychus citri TaxID=50023 RepID=UPI0023073805|nr:P-selectin-like isoform X2 [Panonychus citri]
MCLMKNVNNQDYGKSLRLILFIFYSFISMLIILLLSLISLIIINWIDGQPLCPPLDPPLYGYIINDGHCLTNIGSTCSLRCKPNYEPLGPCSRSCQSNGSWSGSTLLCLNRALNCPPLTLSESVSVGGPCFNVPGGICQFNCPPGTTLLGSNSIYCTSTGTWSATPPTCSPTGCPPLRSPENGQMSTLCGEQGTGSICTINCNPGYQLIGPGRLICLASGSWDLPLPSCIPVNCPPFGYSGQDVPLVSCIHPLGYQVTESALIPGTICRFSCPNCYLLSGQSTISCSGDGHWNGSVGTCLPIHCPDINIIANGQTSGICIRPNCMDTCSISCNSGYMISSSLVNLVCQSTGQWSGPLPKCIPIPSCPDLSSPDSYSSYRGNCQNAKNGDTCELFCDPCYLPTGRTRVTCQSNGNWDSNLGNCVTNNCPSPVMVNLLTTQGQCKNARCGDICMFTCKTGYELQGSRSLTCGQNGQWDNPFPTCRLTKCPDWQVPMGGIFINECPEGLNCPSLCPGQPNQRCNLRCGAGYRLIGTAEEVICLPGTLQWSQPLPTCEPIR